MGELTAFENACIAMGWRRPAQFLQAFEATARMLGEPVTITDRHYRRWRTPVPPNPKGRNWRILHAMFGVDPRELGFPGPPPSATVSSAVLLTQEGLSDVDRRAFLQDSIGVAAATGLQSPATRSTPLRPAGAVGTAHLVELREGLRSLYHLDDAYGGGDVRRLARRHLTRVQRVINTAKYPDTIGRQLQQLAGETAEHCGWLYYDADQQDEARRYWGEALTVATVLEDASLAILVLASLSMQASYEGRPREGFNLARAAQDRATRYGSPVLQSLLASRAARALSQMQDTTAARRQLAASMRLVENPERGRPSPEWAAFHGQAELDYAQGLMYTDSGHHGAAVQFLRAALAHQDRTYGRNRALYRLTLARSLIHAGEVDEAAAHAVESLEHLEEVESGRVTRRLDEVASLLHTAGAVTASEAADQLTAYAETREPAA